LIRQAIGEEREPVVAMDWTDFVLRQAQDEGGRPDDPDVELGDDLRTRATAAVADGLQGRTDGPAQRIRGYVPDAPEGGAARGRAPDDPRRSRFRRCPTDGIPGATRLRICDPVSRRYVRQQGRPSASSG
jgi:hypothetical protein